MLFRANRGGLRIRKNNQQQPQVQKACHEFKLVYYIAGEKPHNTAAAHEQVRNPQGSNAHGVLRHN